MYFLQAGGGEMRYREMCLLYLTGEGCFLDVRLMCTKIRCIYETGKMFNKNLFIRLLFYT